MQAVNHQYIERRSGRVCHENLTGDRLVNFLYSTVRENMETVYRAVTGARASALLGFLKYDSILAKRGCKGRELLTSWGCDPAECLDDPETLNTPRKVFERRIRYWDCRPMPPDPEVITAPADSRLLVGSFARDSLLRVKDKFFSYPEMLGDDKTRWLGAFTGGDFALYRLTPDKYHYVHAPVAGRVVDHYQINGQYHSCNPAAQVDLVTSHSKNKRVVTIIDSDVPGGTQAGLVAQVEVVALMVGRIDQCYSRQFYDDPEQIMPGMFLAKGQPKSLFKPGSSTVVNLFQAGRVRFDRDLIDNQRTPHVYSRFTLGFGQPLVETEVAVRSSVGRAQAPRRRREAA
jgi:phosphatidylserine decarboxylase